MKFYYSPGSCSLAVHILLNELKIKSEYVRVDLKTKKTADGTDYLTINPKGAVPAIETPQGLLTENAIIHQYLADNFKGEFLLPAVPKMERYKTLEWLNFITTELHKGFSLLFNSDPTLEAVKKTIIIPRLLNKFTYVDEHLANHEYLMGDHYMLPDGYLFVMLLWARQHKLPMQDYPHLTDYFKRLLKKDSVKTALTDEGLKVSIEETL